MLSIVATPIGNLKDITFRAVETLKDADYILCEDTRHSRKLLDAYDIKTPLKSFHKFSEAKHEEKVIADLKEGKRVALISDAGTPLISDPGSRLVKRCVAEGLPVTPVPGPCAAITALSASGLDCDRFLFVGFLPKKAGGLKRELEKIMQGDATAIAYESAKRIHKVLKIIEEIDPDYPLVIARELTKKFEEFRRGNASQLLTQNFKGELVILFTK